MARQTAAEKAAAQAQGNFEGSWEVAIGGKAPTSEKVKVRGGAVELTAPEGGFKKGRVYRVEGLMRDIGPDIQDVIDSTTQQPVGTNKTDRLRIMDLRIVEDVTEELARLAAVEGGGEGGDGPGPGPSDPDAEPASE